MSSPLIVGSSTENRGGVTVTSVLYQQYGVRVIHFGGYFRFWFSLIYFIRILANSAKAEPFQNTGRRNVVV